MSSRGSIFETNIETSTKVNKPTFAEGRYTTETSLEKDGVSPKTTSSFEKTQEELQKTVEARVIAQINDKIQEREIKYTEVLGVFVALFTFVSVNITIFTKISSIGSAMVFVMFMFVCLIGFVFSLHYIIWSDRSNFNVNNLTLNWDKTRILLGVVGIIILLFFVKL